MSDEKKKNEEEDIVKLKKKDLDQADKVRATLEDRLDALERGARLSNNTERLQKIANVREQVRNAPKEAFRDKGFISNVWTFICNVARWAWACCTGALSWVLEVAMSAVRFLEDILFELGECFTPFRLAA